MYPRASVRKSTPIFVPFVELFAFLEDDLLGDEDTVGGELGARFLDGGECGLEKRGAEWACGGGGMEDVLVGGLDKISTSCNVFGIGATISSSFSLFFSSFPISNFLASAFPNPNGFPSLSTACRFLNFHFILNSPDINGTLCS